MSSLTGWLPLRQNGLCNKARKFLRNWFFQKIILKFACMATFFYITHVPDVYNFRFLHTCHRKTFEFFISLQLSYTESWKFSTGQFFLYMYNFWYLWQISGLVWMLIWADVVVWYSTPNVQKTESLNFWKQIWTTNVRNPERPKPRTSETPNVRNPERPKPRTSQTQNVLTPNVPNPDHPKPRSSETWTVNPEV